MGHWRYETLMEAPTGVFKKLFAHGVRPRYQDLVGWDFRGYNPPPAPHRLLGFSRFVKGFYQLAGDPPPEKASRIYGYNLACAVRAPAHEWRVLPNEHSPSRHGFYDVSVPEPGSKYDRYPNSLFLNYGVPENHGLNPERLLRDYLVQIEPNNPDLLLGVGYAKVGPVLLVECFFLLERLRPHHYRP